VRRAASVAFLVLQAVASSVSLAAPPESAPPGSYVSGRVLVIPRPGLPDAEMAKIAATHGGRARRITSTGLYIVDLPSGVSEEATARALAGHPHVKSAELDRRIAPSLSANDPYLGSEWHITTMGAAAAWNLATGSGVTIAILDSGVDGSHPDLSGQMVAGWNFYDNTASTLDVYGHGTVVADGAAATLNNGIGVASVAGNARIMPLRVTDTSGYGYWSLVAQGLNYAADHGARVANVSFQGVAGSATVQSAAQYFRSKGGLVVVAAGNSGVNENITPTTTMIPVSATDSNDAIASWSSYGTFVAMSAPGVGIWSTAAGGGYGSYSGTSIASPLVAGTVALMMSANPALSNSQVESLLYSTATDLGASGRDIYYGYGRVNAAAAVQAAAGTTVVVADKQPPTVSITAPAANASVTGLVAVNVSALDNVGVTKVVLAVNGATLASDLLAPYAFSWDSTTAANGTATLVATAYDAAGNVASSVPVAINVANSTQPVVSTLQVAIANPTAGSVTGTVQVQSHASDVSSATVSQALYIDGVLKASGTGLSLAYSWNTRKAAKGVHTIEATATDSLGGT